MLFSAHAAQEVDRERMEHLGELLGIIWTRDQAMALREKPPAPGEKREKPKPRERLIIPLLAGFKPEILDFVKKSFGSPTGIDAPQWYQPEQADVVEAFDMPREEFVQLAGIFTSLIPKTEHK